MKKQFSPASIVSFVGALLAVTGLVSFFNDATNLSVPTFFYGVPILLIGLAMKNSELAPAKSLISESELNKLKINDRQDLINLIAEVTRFRYGQRVHLETSLQALKLWDEKKPPKLLEISLLEIENNFAIKMKFESKGVTLKEWEEKKDRLGRFFSKNLNADISSSNPEEINLELRPKSSNKEKLAPSDFE